MRGNQIPSQHSSICQFTLGGAPCAREHEQISLSCIIASRELAEIASNDFSYMRHRSRPLFACGGWKLLRIYSSIIVYSVVNHLDMDVKGLQSTGSVNLDIAAHQGSTKNAESTPKPAIFCWRVIWFFFASSGLFSFGIFFYPSLIVVHACSQNPIKQRREDRKKDVKTKDR